MYVRAKTVLEEEGERFNRYDSTWKHVYSMLLELPVGTPVCVLDFKDLHCPKLEKNQLTSATFFLMPEHCDLSYFAGPNHKLLVIYDLNQSNLLTRLYVVEGRLNKEVQSNFLQTSGSNIDVDIYVGKQEAIGVFMQVVSQYLSR